MPREEKMETRKRLDEYLDGALDAVATRELETAVSRDPEMSEMLKAMQGERSLRTDVYESYMPASDEAKAFAAQVMEACHDEAAAPVGRVGSLVWTRRIAGIAAGLVIAIGSFVAGRATVPPTQIVQVSVPDQTFTFAAPSVGGEPVYQVFSNRDEFMNFMSHFEQTHPQFRQQQENSAVAFGTQNSM